jgi:large subunit ribosomal protein L3e
MSHRKFEHPRHHSLAYLPKRRTKHHRGRIRSYPRDDASKPVHLTAFVGYKAGMTHVVKYQERREGKKTIKKDVVHSASVVECPPVKIIGYVGYVETPRGSRALSTVWAQNLDSDVKRRFYKNWMASKGKAFSKYVDRKYKSDKASKENVQRDIDRITKYASTVRVVIATQIRKLGLRQHKAHILEVQVNGGTTAAKVQWANSQLEQEVRVGSVFEQSECIDVIGVSKGYGTQGVVKRFDVKRLQRKSHRGCRKVACIGAWHPSAVKWTVPRRGQEGYHSRTELNKKIYRIGAGANTGVENNATTEADAVTKNITPLGGFPHYGEVNEDYVLIKGGIIGPKKRAVTLRKSIFPTVKSW